MHLYMKNMVVFYVVVIVHYGRDFDVTNMVSCLR